MTFNVAPQFRCRPLDILVTQVIDDSLVARHAGFPFSHFDAVAKSPKENLKEIAKRAQPGLLYVVVVG